MRKSRKPFMVEFSGTPEAGKTTAIRVVAFVPYDIKSYFRKGNIK